MRYFFFLIFFSNCIISQISKVDYYNSIDNKMFAYNKKNDPSFDSIVAFVNKNFTTNEDKVRAYYSWIAVNILYDVEHLDNLISFSKMNMRNSSSISQTPDTVFNHKKAVCEGFSLLFNKFCQASDIPSFMACGYTKLPDGEVYTEILHTWNVVKPDSNWRLLDVTWSGGYINSMNQYVKRFSDKYFFTSPDDFVKDHLPLDPMWQLRNKPISKNVFFNLKDTTGVKSDYLHYSDSITNYIKASASQKKYTDHLHYHLYDPKNLKFMREMDIVINNVAADYLMEASIHYETFFTFQKEKMGRYPSVANCKKAKVLLEIPKNDIIKTINYLEKQKALTTEYDTIFTEMKTQANVNLNSIKGTIASINSYLKSKGINPNK